jgi:hypothetical protein
MSRQTSHSILFLLNMFKPTAMRITEPNFIDWLKGKGSFLHQL